MGTGGHLSVVVEFALGEDQALKLALKDIDAEGEAVQRPQAVTDLRKVRPGIPDSRANSASER